MERNDNIKNNLNTNSNGVVNVNPYAKNRSADTNTTKSIDRNIDNASEDSGSKKKKGITFMSLFIGLSIALLILIVVSLFVTRIADLNKTQIAEGIQEVRLNTAAGELVLQYKIYVVDGRNVVVILTNRLGDEVSISNLITNILYSEGLTLTDTDVMLLDGNDLGGLSIEEYFASIENRQDPLNELFEGIDEVDLYEAHADIDPIDFALYIGATNYSDDRFSITYLEENSYRVELKNGFTEDQFRQDFLSQFLNIDDLTIIYVDQNDLRLQNP